MRYIIYVLEIYCVDKDIYFINVSHPVNLKPKTTNKLSALLLWTNYVYFSGKVYCLIIGIPRRERSGYTKR